MWTDSQGDYNGRSVGVRTHLGTLLRYGDSFRLGHGAASVGSAILRFLGNAVSLPSRVEMNRNYSFRALRCESDNIVLQKSGILGLHLCGNLRTRPVLRCSPLEPVIKCSLVQALRLCTVRKAHRGRRVIALPFHDHGTRRG